MDRKALMDKIRSTARSLGIVDVAVANADAWETDGLVGKVIPKNERPSSMMHGSRSVVVIGIPVSRTILATAPSSYYSEHYKTINSMLDHAGQRIAMELEIEGHTAAFVSRDGYQGIEGLRKSASSFFSHRHAAYLAGMGTFGISNMLLTEKSGPRMRFTSVITTADLPYSGPLKKGLCKECMRCVSECPENAVASEGYPRGITQKQRCVEYSAILRSKGCSPCGRCIFVCPVGDDVNDHLPTDGTIKHIQSYIK